MLELLLHPFFFAKETKLITIFFTSYVYNLCVLFLWQMSRFGKSLHQRWDEDDESDDDDLLILAGLIEGLKRNKRKKNFHGSLPGRHSVQRGILGGHDGIFRDYFADPCIYNDKHFRRRFRDYF